MGGWLELLALANAESERGQRREILQDPDLALELLDLAPDAAELGLDLEHVLELARPFVEDLGERFLLGFLVLDAGLDVVKLLRHVLRRPRVPLELAQRDDLLHERFKLVDGHAQLPTHRSLRPGRAGRALLGNVATRILNRRHHLLGDRVHVRDDQVDLAVIDVLA